MLNDAADRFVETLIAEKRELRNQVNVGFTLAVLMQRVAEKDGHDFGIPAIAPGMPMEVAKAMITKLEAQLELDQKSAAIVKEGTDRAAEKNGSRVPNGVAE